MHFRDESQKRDFIRAVNAAQVALEDDNAEDAYDIVYLAIREIERTRYLVHAAGSDSEESDNGVGELAEKLCRAKHARQAISC